MMLPAINTTGVFKLKEPYANLLPENQMYTCVAVRKIEELLSLGEFPYQKYYRDFSIDEATFEQDIVNQVCIVTVVAENGTMYNFPSSYLLSFPSPQGINYAVLGIGINVGSLPVDTDLSSVMTEIERIVSSKFGIKATAASLQLSQQTVISYDNHKSLLAARQAEIKKLAVHERDAPTLLREIEKLNSKIKFLEGRLGLQEKS